jgi:hypothetical protein
VDKAHHGKGRWLPEFGAERLSCHNGEQLEDTHLSNLELGSITGVAFCCWTWALAANAIDRAATAITLLILNPLVKMDSHR